MARAFSEAAESHGALGRGFRPARWKRRESADTRQQPCPPTPTARPDSGLQGRRVCLARPSLQAAVCDTGGGAPGPGVCARTLSPFSSCLGTPFKWRVPASQLVIDLFPADLSGSAVTRGPVSARPEDRPNAVRKLCQVRSGVGGRHARPALVSVFPVCVSGRHERFKREFRSMRKNTCLRPGVFHRKQKIGERRAKTLHRGGRADGT